MLTALVLFLFVLPSGDAHKILVYNSKFAHSHTNFMARIADILAEAGHEVTSLMPIMDSTISDGTTKSRIIHVEPTTTTAEMFETFARMKSNLFSGNIFNPMKTYRAGKFFARAFSSQCRALLDNSELLKQLKDDQYDVLIAEHFDMCGVGLVGVIKPKSLISVTTGAVFGHLQQEEFGIPAAHSYDPAMFVSHLNIHSTWDRAVNWCADWIFSLNLYFVRGEMDALFREKLGADYPSVRDIGSRSAYVFVNSEPLIDFATPTVSKEWEQLLSKRPRAVLMSFGSMVKSIYLPEEVKMAFIETVKAFPDVTFIWKYEEEDQFSMNIGSKVDNLFLTKWMPQVDILNHKNLRVFITHGGMGSTQETAMRGVPGIFVPIFAEQPRNAGMMEYNGLGKVIDKNELSNSSKFVEVVREVLENPSYYENAQRIAAMLRTKPFSSKEQLIKYTEFAAEFGPSAALRPQSHDMNWIEYNNVDIIVAGFLTLLISGFIALKLLLTIGRKFSISKKSKLE